MTRLSFILVTEWQEHQIYIVILKNTQKVDRFKGIIENNGTKSYHVYYSQITEATYGAYQSGNNGGNLFLVQSYKSMASHLHFET